MVHQETQLFEDEPALIRCLPQLNDLRLAGELTDLSIELDCIFAIGGRAEDASFSTVDKFDTKKRRWVELAPLYRERFNHSAVSVQVGRERVICVFGGWTRNYEEEYLKTCELYSPREDR
ncbi:unnamed protein product [Dibothriocephalus latus]|uniref:Kelch repeat protein n=1 Tax=Dibothriocephalus latus TaxID=60516 RepID=A0A3P7PCD0_DIBLA|nr:unnamed protein product [Dibothriocephalus latus]